MKKTIILLNIFCLSACCCTQNIETNKTIASDLISEIENDSVSAEEKNKFDDYSLKSFEPGSTWINKNSRYFVDDTEQHLKIDSGNLAELKFEELYLYPGQINFLFELVGEQKNDDKFQVYDDENNLLFESEINEGNNRITFNNEKMLYSGCAKFIFDADKDNSDLCIRNFKIKQPKDIYMIHVNQIGYLEKARKIAVFSGNQGDYYNLVEADTDETVMSFPLTLPKESKYTNEQIAWGDFTNFSKQGTYYLESSMGFKSHNFKINDNVYEELLCDSLNMFTLQRCNFAVNNDISDYMQHGKCHSELAQLVSTSEMIDVSGGWHDAGDYGRYVETAVKALSDLLLSYIINADVYNDGMSQVNSGNGIPDILDEIRYELEWLLKMQREDGGVYSRAITKNFPGNILPEDDNNFVYVTQVSTASSAGFCAVMALASKVYKKIDDQFADKCLDAALRANKYLNATSEYNPTLPEGFSAGDYVLTNDEYYRFYAKIALWYITDQNKYLKEAFDFVKDDFDLYNVYWEPLMAYPSFLYLSKATKKEDHYEFISRNFYRYLNSICEKTDRDDYRISLNGTYTWGSNQNVMDKSMMLLMGYDLTNNHIYKAIAEEHLDYILGKNFHDMSFVVGYGANYPHNIHHRIAIVNNDEFIGAMVGGPDASMEDSIIKTMFNGKNVGPAQIYVDDENSYSTNEVAIHFNSSLVFVLAYLNQGE